MERVSYYRYAAQHCPFLYLSYTAYIRSSKSVALRFHLVDAHQPVLACHHLLQPLQTYLLAAHLHTPYSVEPRRLLVHRGDAREPPVAQLVQQTVQQGGRAPGAHVELPLALRREGAACGEQWIGYREGGSEGNKLDEGGEKNEK